MTPHMTETAETVLERRYYLKDKDNEIIEDWKTLSRRVANAVASVDKENNDYEKIKESFFEIIYNLDFLPNSPCLMNAGTDMQMLSACFVLPIDDSMESIFESVKNGALVNKWGGGTGYSFSRIRGKNSSVRSTNGVASGPISFAKVFDVATDVIKQGGRRRGANMGVLRVDHPDIMDFISAKEKDGELSNFNFSVAITDTFMEAVKSDSDYNLIDPTNKEVIGSLSARNVFDEIVNRAWKNGEPGVLFIDAANRANPTPQLGEFEATNPSLRNGTRVWTTNGIHKIEDLEGKFFTVRNLHGELSKAKCWKSGKDKELFTIRFQGGVCHYATPEHKWPVIDLKGYITKKTTSQLKVGDRVFKGPFEDSVSTGLLFTECEGFATGWNLGDGWRTLRKDGRVQYGFIIEGDKRQDSILLKLQEFFISKEVQTDFTDMTEFNFSNKKLRSFFEKIGHNGKENGLPSCVWETASEDFIRGMLDGLFSSDGCIDVNNRRIIYTSKDKKLITDISNLLSFYGIKNGVRKSKAKNISFPNGKTYDKTYIRYDLSIRGLPDILHFSQIIQLSHQGKNRDLKMVLELLRKQGKVIASDSLVVKELNFGEVRSDVWDISVYDKTHCFKISHVITGNCGEQFLLPYEACNLGSINLGRYVVNKKVDFDRLGETVKTAVRFLDNVVDCNEFPIKEIEEMTKKTRKIGLGIMGLHDMLIQLELPYDSSSGRKIASDVMEYINSLSKTVSFKLGKEKGGYSEQYTYLPKGYNGPAEASLRNAARTSIQPTGTVSMIANCGSGCEPYFAIVTEKHVMDGDKLLLINKYFELVAKKEGFFSDDLMKKIAKSGTVIGHEEIPEKWQNIFKTSQDIRPEDHIKMQGALQKHVCSSISKTINMPYSATIEDVKQAYLLGWDIGCKGLTVYRDGSRDNQVLNAGKNEKRLLVNKEGMVKKELPDEINAKRYKLHGKDGESVYIIVCFDESENPVEVFAKFPYENRQDLSEKSTMWTTACRLASLLLRYGTPIEEIIKQLDRSSGNMFDLPAQLGKLLKGFMASTTNGYSEPCPDCEDGVLIYESGCAVCKECGWSKCA